MKNFTRKISEDMYHRVYRLMKRDTDPRLIAAALNLPLRTILNVIARLKKFEQTNNNEVALAPVAGKTPGEWYLDTYFLAKTRYAVLQLVGHVVKEESATLEHELMMVRTSIWKSIAIQLSDVLSMDDVGARMLLDFCQQMNVNERYVALLDPSPQIEPVITRFQFEPKIKVFGTETSFEKEALSRRLAGTQTRPRSRRDIA